MTCASCHHSQPRVFNQPMNLPALYCLHPKHEGPAVKRCEDFDREPGADEEGA